MKEQWVYCNERSGCSTSVLRWIVYWAVALVPLIATAQPQNSKTTTLATGPKAKVANSQWVYEVNEDKMRGTKTFFAYVDSVTKLNFEFPYNGGSTVRLQIYWKKKNEYFVSILIDKGQFVLRSISDIPELKFDDEPVMKLQKINNGSMNVGPLHEHGRGITLSLGNGKTFVEKLKKSKRLMMDARFFEVGKRQFEFNVEGLEIETEPSRR